MPGSGRRKDADQSIREFIVTAVSGIIGGREAPRADKRISTRFNKKLHDAGVTLACGHHQRRKPVDFSP
jgi:hypothetical protein